MISRNSLRKMTDVEDVASVYGEYYFSRYESGVASHSHSSAVSLIRNESMTVSREGHERQS